jgi:ubiquinone/menaquinone biosynthesis C-methylase UbiE
MKQKYAEQLLKKTKEGYDKIAEEFSTTRKEVWEEMSFLFNDYVIPGDKILDLGCGNGRFFELLEDKDINYIGVDFSGKLIEIARKKYPGTKFQTADALDLSFPNNYFDKIYSVAVLHHIPSKQLRLQFLKEARRILKPNGLLILTVWKPKSKKDWSLFLKYTTLKLIGKLERRDVFQPWGKKMERYFHLFSEEELANSAKEAKFKIIKEGIMTNEKGNRRNIYLVAEK